MSETYQTFVKTLHEWMWEHLMDCEHKEIEKKPLETLGPEWVEGEIFKVITEYDERAPKGNIPPYVKPEPPK